MVRSSRCSSVLLCSMHVGQGGGPEAGTEMQEVIYISGGMGMLMDTPGVGWRKWWKIALFDFIPTNHQGCLNVAPPSLPSNSLFQMAPLFALEVFAAPRREGYFWKKSSHNTGKGLNLFI